MGSFNVNYSAGGILDEVKKIPLVENIGSISGFAHFTQPYNVMECFEIPALIGDYEFELTLLDEEVEIIGMSLTCSGYGEDDHYDLYVNDNKWFDNWYVSEVKEGLFVGTSTYVYRAPENTKVKLVFKNDSGTQKNIYFGVRLLHDID